MQQNQGLNAKPAAATISSELGSIEQELEQFEALVGRLYQVKHRLGCAVPEPGATGGTERVQEQTTIGRLSAIRRGLQGLQQRLGGHLNDVENHL